MAIVRDPKQYEKLDTGIGPAYINRINGHTIWYATRFPALERMANEQQMERFGKAGVDFKQYPCERCKTKDDVKPRIVRQSDGEYDLCFSCWKRAVREV